MKVMDFANELYIELGSPTSTSIPAIAYWLRAQVGTINTLLFEDFYVDDSGGTYEILDTNGEISPEAVAILKAMYRVYDYNVQIRSNMNALALDSIIEVTDQGSSVKKANRNEISKTFVTLKKLEQESLEKLITSYRLRGANPRQVVGDDETVGYNGVDGYSSVTDLRLGTTR